MTDDIAAVTAFPETDIKKMAEYNSTTVTEEDPKTVYMVTCWGPIASAMSRVPGNIFPASSHVSHTGQTLEI